MATLTGRTIKSTYDQLIQLEDQSFQDGFGTASLSGSLELTGSQYISGALNITGGLVVKGTASIEYLQAVYETSSVIFSSGSTKFGDSTDDTHQFTGSVSISGSANSKYWSGSFSGSFSGLANSASNAERSVSASQADNAGSSSISTKTNSVIVQNDEGSAAGHYVLLAQSTTGEVGVKTDSGIGYVPQTNTLTVTKVIGQLEGSASFAETASVLLGTVESASLAVTASLAISTSVINVTSQSFAASGDGPFTGSFSSSLYSLLSGSFTGSYTGSLTGSVLGNLIGTASIADNATTASHITTASFANNATTASHTSGTSSFANISTLSRGGSGSFSGSFQGNGKDLTNVDGYVVNNNAQERVVLATSESQSGSAATNLTFDGTTLTVVGNINTGQGATEVYLMNQNVQVSSSVQFNGLGVGTAASGVAGAILATNDVVAFASSDERLKENLEPIGSATEKVGQLTGYTFDWIPMEEIHVHSGHDIGVIAQEVEKVLPEIVEDRGNGYKAVKYEKLTALLIQAVNEQQKQIEDLTTKINWLENRL